MRPWRPFVTCCNLAAPVISSMAPGASPKITLTLLYCNCFSCLSSFLSYKLTVWRDHGLPSSAMDPSTQYVDRHVTCTRWLFLKWMNERIHLLSKCSSHPISSPKSLILPKWLYNTSFLYHPIAQFEKFLIVFSCFYSFEGEGREGITEGESEISLWNCEDLHRTYPHLVVNIIRS